MFILVHNTINKPKTNIKMFDQKKFKGKRANIAVSDYVIFVLNFAFTWIKWWWGYFGRWDHNKYFFT